MTEQEAFDRALISYSINKGSEPDYFWKAALEWVKQGRDSHVNEIVEATTLAWEKRRQKPHVAELVEALNQIMIESKEDEDNRSYHIAQQALAKWGGKQ